MRRPQGRVDGRRRKIRRPTVGPLPKNDLVKTKIMIQEVTHRYYINVNSIEPAPLSCRKIGFQRKGWCSIATAAPAKPKNDVDCVKKQQMPTSDIHNFRKLPEVRVAGRIGCS